MTFPRKALVRDDNGFLHEQYSNESLQNVDTVNGLQDYLSKSASYQLKYTDPYLILVDATSAPVVLSTPAESVGEITRRYRAVKIDSSANAVSFSSSGGTIIGVSSTTEQGQSIELIQIAAAEWAGGRI